MARPPIRAGRGLAFCSDPWPGCCRWLTSLPGCGPPTTCVRQYLAQLRRKLEPDPITGSCRGVLISVTTVPAAERAALGLAFGAGREIWASALQRVVDLTGTTASGGLTLTQGQSCTVFP